MLMLAVLLGLLGRVSADVYMNNPRGSNNKLSEQSNTAQNQNRLFDSQNNAKAGYQIGDNCQPVCQTANRNYDATKPGAMEGLMTYYQGSELYVEWHAQHGCGLGHPNLRCQFILQYMSEADNPTLREGTKRGNQNTAGGQQEPPVAEQAQDPTLGQHEPFSYYIKCRARERNKGLYTADQNVNDNRGATATRQNPGGNANANQRHGLECPEERDYYPYWHPTPWHDIAVLTDEPVKRCDYYRAESQNIKAKGECSEPEHNHPETCQAGGGRWIDAPAFDEPPPECVGSMRSRDNHNGNVRNGKPMYYVWRIPEHVDGRVVLRLRYNITTTDLEPTAIINQETPLGEDPKIDPFFIGEAFNDRDPGQRRRSPFRGGRPIISNDPQADWLNIGSDTKNRVLQLQINTNQVARTFEDRTHTFNVRARPREIPESARIVNYNVRGRRGNIVQVYPSVEYDFVPADLTVEQGTFLHFQWTGSDANPKGNAGNGRQGTDRSNLVQVASRGENVPLPIQKHTLFFNAEAEPDNSEEARELVDRFAYLGQDSLVTCDPEEDGQQATTNCKQLNGASAYFDGGAIEMQQIGTHHIASTRNNDFSNRSQKATITVTRPPWEWYTVLCVVIGLVLVLSAAAYASAAIYAFKRPTSWLFSKRYRPRALRWFLSKATLEGKIQERKQRLKQRQEQFAALVHSSGAEATSMLGKPADVGRPGRAPEGAKGAPGSAVPGGGEVAKPWEDSAHGRCVRRCRLCGLQEQGLAMFLYLLLNVLAFIIGFFSNLGMGFQGCLAFPVAKGAGYTLDLNLAFLVLPTLKSLQTAMRNAGATREWMPIDDPIAFHIKVAGLLMLGSAVHVAAHIVHMLVIAGAPPMQQDPLDHWNLTPEEKTGGMPVGSQLLDLSNRCAGLTGIIITALMVLMTITALPCARRGTNCLTRRLGGFNLFWRVHLSWKWIYVLLLIHAPARLWIWLLFPALCLAVDRAFLANRQRPYVALRRVKLLPRDVMSLTFDVPHGFSYQAGQYILLGWRGEWHPFTLTSAPEEPVLSVHIRAPDNLDWCSALRKRLTIEAPAVTGGAARDKDGETRTRDRARSGIEYVARPGLHSQILYCQPAPAAPPGHPATPNVTGNAKNARPGKRGSATYAEQASGSKEPCVNGEVLVPIERGKSGLSVDSTKSEQLPPDAVMLQITGPFGAPAQKIWQYETIMAVGAGIGVTPFASILRSVQLRAKQRQAIQGTLSAPSGQRRRKDDELAASSRMGTEQLLRDIITVPRRIYFYWIVRSQEEFEWFYELLSAAVEGPARENVYITTFTTGEIELKQVRELPCVHSQVFGRPNWGRIFKQQKEQHVDEHIGVFLCGSPAIGSELAKQSAKHTDPPGVPGGTRFSFFQEHF